VQLVVVFRQAAAAVREEDPKVECPRALPGLRELVQTSGLAIVLRQGRQAGIVEEPEIGLRGRVPPVCGELYTSASRSSISPGRHGRPRRRTLEHFARRVSLVGGEL